MIRKLAFLFCENEHGTGDVCFPDVKMLDGHDLQRPSSATAGIMSTPAIGTSAKVNRQRRFAEARGCGAPSDKFERADHPYDTGYWLRYDGKPRPKGREQRQGWDVCDKELASEAKAHHNRRSSKATLPAPCAEKQSDRAGAG